MLSHLGVDDATVPAHATSNHLSMSQHQIPAQMSPKATAVVITGHCSSSHTYLDAHILRLGKDNGLNGDVVSVDSSGP